MAEVSDDDSQDSASKKVPKKVMKTRADVILRKVKDKMLYKEFSEIRHPNLPFYCIRADKVE